MNEHVLYEAGLTKAEAKAYSLLIQNNPSTPPQLSQLIGETRTNTYKILETLEQKGLVTRDETQKKLRYWANNPSVLLDTIKKQRQDIEAAEKRVQNSLPSLVDEYFKHSEQPSVHYFNGKKAIQKIYDDQIATNLPITFIHSPELAQTFGIQTMHTIRNQFPRRNIHRHVFYPDIPAQGINPGEPTTPVDESDRLMQQSRTWLQQGDLTSPVEWSVYGNKVAVISAGSEFVGMIIESPQIANSFREILDLLDRKIRAEPSYDTLPHNLLFTKTPESLRR